MLYIDPAATSMLLTSITAIVVGCGAAIFIAWRSFKKKVNKAMHKDENANKEVEDELVINEDLKEEGQSEENTSAEQTSAESAEAQQAAEKSNTEEQ